jgi:hypothetical protein
MRNIVLAFIVCLPLHLEAQHTEKFITLSNQLNEASGIVAVDDTTFIVHNDGGNEPMLYVIDRIGKLLHTCRVLNATNEDWEDLTLDDAGNLYIGDFGNNLNTRKDLKIYKVNIYTVLNQHQVSPEIIEFHYKEQVAFPPRDSELEFDCEALTYFKGKLHLFTKSSAKPWNGYTYHYELPVLEGSYEINRIDSIFIGKSGWMLDAVTGITSDDRSLYILTYNRVVVIDMISKKIRNEINFKGYNQKEGIAVGSDGSIYIVAEKQRFVGGPYLYLINYDKE